MEGKTKTRTPPECNGEELRRRIRSKQPEVRESALTELRRRRDNLRGAALSAWEHEALDKDIDKWLRDHA